MDLDQLALVEELFDDGTLGLCADSKLLGHHFEDPHL
jgi:hypothetical protein